MRLMGLVTIRQEPKTRRNHPVHRIYPHVLEGPPITRANQVC